jgi:hypothetical protein
MSADQMLGALVEHHPDKHVPRIEAAHDLHPLAVPDLGDLLSRDQNFLDLLVFGASPGSRSIFCWIRR